ncbi:glycosyltransferase [Saccharothrix saharensis]|uniref:glycosyltransferase n=1 Tax=Saccharothrix saharensis TaxID=571190 RepID=UPI0036804F38
MNACTKASDARERTPAGERPMTVSVVIPAHNEEATIRETVASCLAQTYPLEQVIVVADNCTDSTVECARAAGAIVIEGKGGSKAAAQNMALPLVTSALVVALDGDATLSADAVALMVDTIDAGAVGTCPAALPGDTDTTYSRYRTLYHAISNGWVRKLQDVLGRQMVLSGMANCHRMDVLRQCGGFPEDNITEDFNLTWMLHRRGHRVAFTEGAFVYTREPTSLRELLSQVHRWTSGFAQSMVKHRAPLHDASSFVVVATQVVDGVVGGLATFSFVPFIARHGVKALWRWWSVLWVVVSAASLGVAVRQVGWRTALKCLPSWFVLQTLIGPLTAWWLVREWVLGKHLLSWTGRHGLKADITPMTARRKLLLFGCAAAAGVAALVNRRTRR